jgi:hypothetical protein
MRNQGGSFTPQMQLKSGRFHHESRSGVVSQIQRHLVRGTGACRGDGTAKPRDYPSMHVSGNDALDLRMTRDDRLQRMGIREPDPVHVQRKGVQNGVVIFSYTVTNIELLLLHSCGVIAG